MMGVLNQMPVRELGMGNRRLKIICQELRRPKNRRGGKTKDGWCPWSQVRLHGGGQTSLG